MAKPGPRKTYKQTAIAPTAAESSDPLWRAALAEVAFAILVVSDLGYALDPLQQDLVLFCLVLGSDEADRA